MWHQYQKQFLADSQPLERWYCRIITYTGLEVPTNAASSIHQRRPRDTKGRSVKADSLDIPLKDFIFTGDKPDEFQKLSSKLAKSFKNNGSDSIIYAPIGNKMVNFRHQWFRFPPQQT